MIWSPPIHIDGYGMSLYLYVFSHTIISCHYNYAYLLKYVVFLLLLPLKKHFNWLLFMYLNHIDFHVSNIYFIYPVTLLNTLINSNSLSINSPEFSVYNVYCVQIIYPFPMIKYLIASYFIALTRNSCDIVWKQL